MVNSVREDLPYKICLILLSEFFFCFYHPDKVWIFFVLSHFPNEGLRQVETFEIYRTIWTVWFTIDPSKLLIQTKYQAVCMALQVLQLQPNNNKKGITSHKRLVAFVICNYLCDKWRCCRFVLCGQTMHTYQNSHCYAEGMYPESISQMDTSVLTVLFYDTISLFSCRKLFLGNVRS